jgi:hypothetical protein
MRVPHHALVVVWPLLVEVAAVSTALSHHRHRHLRAGNGFFLGVNVLRQGGVALEEGARATPRLPPFRRPKKEEGWQASKKETVSLLWEKKWWELELQAMARP